MTAGTPARGKQDVKTQISRQRFRGELSVPVKNSSISEKFGVLVQLQRLGQWIRTLEGWNLRVGCSGVPRLLAD